MRSYTIEQAFLTLVLEGHCPANFSSNPNQTHLNQLIKLFRITSKLQAGEFDQGWSKTLQDSDPPGPGLDPAIELDALYWLSIKSHPREKLCLNV